VLPDGGAVPKPAERATWLKLLKPLAKVDDVVNPPNYREFLKTQRASSLTDLTAGNIPSEPMAAACPDECGASVSGD
jgi:hypothetical protein